MGNVTIGENDMDDDDDAMEQDGQQGGRQRPETRKAEPQFKYQNGLQELANRSRDEIIIDLDDLYTVGP